MSERMPSEYSEYIENLIAENQKQFIKQFEDSLLGRCYLSFWKMTGALSDFRSRREEYVARIYGLKMRQYIKVQELRGRTMMFHIKNHSLPPKVRIHRDELAIAGIIKDEERYIKEWIEFHLLQGVQRFYLLDNGCTDRTEEILKPYIESGTVEFIPYPGRQAQIFGYCDLVHRLKKAAKWVAFIDVDEYLFAADGSDLKAFLAEYEKYPALAVNWVLYGPGGHEKRPEGLIMENYTETFANRNHEMNLRVKLIVQPAQVCCFRTPHTALFKKARPAVNEKKKPMNGTSMLSNYGGATTRANSIEKIRINHYWTKSLEDLNEKCRKGRSDSSIDLLVADVLRRIEGETIIDTSILQFLPEMKERMMSKEK